MNLPPTLAQWNYDALVQSSCVDLNIQPPSPSDIDECESHVSMNETEQGGSDRVGMQWRLFRQGWPLASESDSFEMVAVHESDSHREMITNSSNMCACLECQSLVK